MTEGRRPRHEPEVPVAPVVLNDKGQELSRLIPDALSKFDIELGAAVDEVIVTVSPQNVPDVCRVLKENPRLHFDYLRCLSVVDYVERLEVVYHLFSLEKRHKIVVKTSVSPDEPHVPTITTLWHGADWFEREGHDLYGVVFDGHPNLIPLVLYEGFEGFPGRKSFPFHDYKEW